MLYSRVKTDCSELTRWVKRKRSITVIRRFSRCFTKARVGLNGNDET
jgi:hypothetical protein